MLVGWLVVVVVLLLSLSLLSLFFQSSPSFVDPAAPLPRHASVYHVGTPLPQLSFQYRYCKELRNRAEEVVTQALELYSTKGLKKAVQYLVASNFISDTPR